MAECHPVGFQWVMEAKARGATVIHIDPRYTRTSAVADLHVPLRAGSDIVLLGGTDQLRAEQREVLPRLRGELHQRGDDHRARTSRTPRTWTGCSPASTPSSRVYDPSLAYEGVEVQAASGERDRQQDPGDEAGRSGALVGSAVRPAGGARRTARAARVGTPRDDPTLQHPRCVFQILKRHFARYTPEMVEQACGVPQADFRRVCELITANSGRDRTTAFVYSVGWTSTPSACSTSAPRRSCRRCSATSGGRAAASWRCAGTRPSRGPPTSRRCSTCCPGTSRCRTRTPTRTWTRSSPRRAPTRASGRTCAYTVSLLKAWWGDAATAANDFCFDYLPRLTGSHSTYETVMAQIAGDCPGYFLFGENPAVGSANGKMQRLGLADLDWLVVRDLVMIRRDVLEGRAGDRHRGDAHGRHRHRGVLPARRRAHREERQVHQYPADAAVAPRGGEPAGDARSDLWFAYHLGRRIREKLAASPTRWTGRCRT